MHANHLDVDFAVFEIVFHERIAFVLQTSENTTAYRRELIDFSYFKQLEYISKNKNYVLTRFQFCKSPQITPQALAFFFFAAITFSARSRAIAKAP
ncbi:MAG: hypothetical protein AAF214_00555, partial [Pseudomonadota bacterium]